MGHLLKTSMTRCATKILSQCILDWLSVLGCVSCETFHSVSTMIDPLPRHLLPRTPRNGAHSPAFGGGSTLAFPYHTGGIRTQIE